MNRKRLGQMLIGGIFTLCAAAAAALYDLAAREAAKRSAVQAEPSGGTGAPAGIPEPAGDGRSSAPASAEDRPDRIAFCGVDCGACPDCAEKKCPGCRKTLWPDDDPCPPVACCGKHGVEVCGQCAEFPCQMMREFYEESDSHRAAYARMLELRARRIGEGG